MAVHEKILEESRALKSEVIEKLSALVTAAFGLIAALAWNDAVRSLFVEGGALHFLAKTGMWAYAIFVTLLAVLLTIWIGRVAQKAKGPVGSAEKK